MKGMIMIEVTLGMVVVLTIIYMNEREVKKDKIQFDLLQNRLEKRD